MIIQDFEKKDIKVSYQNSIYELADAQAPTIFLITSQQNRTLLIGNNLVIQKLYRNHIEIIIEIDSNSMKKVSIQSVKNLNLEDYDILRTLGIGKGGLSKLKLARNKKTGEYVVAKFINKAAIIKAQQVDHVYNEILIHSQISHPFIANFQGLAQNSRYLCIIQELVNGTDLSTHLSQVGPLPADQAKFYAANMVYGLEYLQRKNIVHRDIKPENIFIDNKGYLTITDFSFSKIIKKGRTFTICGTPQYMAPQILLNRGYGASIHWWVLGVLIYEMSTGSNPFTADNVMQVYKNVIRATIPFTKVDKFSKDARSILRHLIVPDLSKRYGNLKDNINDIKKHPWFKEIDWQEMIEKNINPIYLPKFQDLGEAFHLDQYPDSGTAVPEVKPSADPFLSW